MKGVLIAGVSSGVGKTTVTIGLIAALRRRRGLRVQPFKVGPDYIDTSYHTQAAGGVASRNLDLWLLPADTMRMLFSRASRTADIAIVEGVMGLYDGRLGGEGLASAAHVAKALDLPVVLVVDAGKLSWSAGALVLGYRSFDPDVRLAGVILNRVGGPRHVAELKESIEQRAGIPVLGWLPTQPELAVPERYLGLVPTTEGPGWQAFVEAAETAVASHVDLSRLLALATGSTPRIVEDDLFPSQPIAPSVAIAVARDQAFSFYYQDGLDLLEAWGAELVPFSPLADSVLPADASAVYIGGGFPELFASDLARNDSMLASLRAAHARGLPIYAECGGLMLLGRSLVDAQGQRHVMAGIVPMDSTLAGTRLTIGYRDVHAARDTLLFDRGQTVRAHEFHWSSVQQEIAEDEAAYLVDDRQPRAEGFSSGETLASYLHVHFAESNGRLARRFVERATSQRQVKTDAVY
jgi:cobyrinic acid a,c-diamide synthase